MIDKLLQIDEASYLAKIAFTLMSVAGFILIHYMIIKTARFSRWAVGIEVQRKVAVFSRNIMAIFVVISLIAIWTGGTHNFVISVAALGAAAVIATKELIVAIMGGIVRFIAKVSLGDRIQVGDVYGEVVDMTLFTTTLLETSSVGIYTGKTVTILNTEFMLKPIKESANQGSYDIRITKLNVPLNERTHLAANNIVKIMNEVCVDYIEAARSEFKATETNKFYDLPNAEPRLMIELVAKDCALFLIRYPIKNGEGSKTEQAIIKEFLKDAVFASVKDGDSVANVNKS